MPQSSPPAARSRYGAGTATTQGHPPPSPQRAGVVPVGGRALWAYCRRVSRRLLFLAALITLAGCSATPRVGQKRAKPTVLTMVNISTDPAELLSFTRNVEQLSHGRLR